MAGWQFDLVTLPKQLVAHLFYCVLSAFATWVQACCRLVYRNQARDVSIPGHLILQWLLFGPLDEQASLVISAKNLSVQMIQIAGEVQVGSETVYGDIAGVIVAGFCFVRRG